MLGKQLQKLIQRATCIAIILLAGASEAHSLQSVAEETSIANENHLLNLPELVDPQLLAQAQQPRTALVIGNADYEDAPLANPDNDANAIYETLKELGFDVPPPLINGNKQEMIEALRQFQDRLEEDGVGVFYYSGHGVQVDGTNYLVPVEADLERKAEVEFEAIELERVINTMNDAGTQFNVLIIDACRDNPFYRRWRSSRGSSTQGLARTDPPRGTLIAYATQPGDVALDGTGDQFSPYTQSLLRHLPTPRISIWDMLSAVGTDVLAVTNEEQLPYVEGVPIGYFSFNPNPELSSAPIQPIIDPFTPAPQQFESSTTQQPVSAPSEPTLISATTGVNYQSLRDALVAGNFREADVLTRSLMLQASGRESEGYFREEEDIRNFSCEDFRIIDQLWLDHSDGRFGFSIQQETYRRIGGANEYNAEIWRKFSDQVGWRVNDQWLLYEDIIFNVSAPKGHLPVGVWFGDTFTRVSGFGALWFLGFPFLDRYADCSI